MGQEQINITVNGQKYKVALGQSIKEALKSLAIEVPSFCYDARLKPFTSCFLCVVEVEGMRNLVPSCSTQVSADMVIQTNSERVQQSRKMALELLLGTHGGDCEPPCQKKCPAHVDIQGYLALMAQGDFINAVKLIKKSLALPFVCGSVCPHPCEAVCRRERIEDPVAIRLMKNMAARVDLRQPYLPPVATPTNQKAAIIGGGPAGLAAAYYLRQKGHQVCIFDPLPQLGGMTRYGIPRFRLPWPQLDAEIESIINLGIEVKQQRWGEDFSLDDLRQAGFKAILIAIGASVSKDARIAGAQEPRVAPYILGGIDFLRQVVLQKFMFFPRHVAVVGGGDVAMDCARVARRLGAEVEIIYRRSPAEMPALPHERQQCEEEGIKIRYLMAPAKVEAAASGVDFTLQVMKMGEPDASGRRKPVPVEGMTETMNYDLIITAIGQETDARVLREEDLPITSKNTLVYNNQTMMTPTPGIFAAGDCAFGPNTVVQALAEGRQAAESMHLYLTTMPHWDDQAGRPLPYTHERGKREDLDFAEMQTRFKLKQRLPERWVEAQERLTTMQGFAPIEVMPTLKLAQEEAQRCLGCGCQAFADCKLRHYATDYQVQGRFNNEAKKHPHPVDDRHPFIHIDHDKCILCGNCVRFCQEGRHLDALSFKGRGSKTCIVPSLGGTLQEAGCDACGMCADVCPTGALSIGLRLPITKKEDLTCPYCEQHCLMTGEYFENRLVRITSKQQTLCRYGRFAPLMEDKFSAQVSTFPTNENTAIVVGGSASLEEIFWLKTAAPHAKFFYVALPPGTGGSHPALVALPSNLSVWEALDFSEWKEEQAANFVAVLSFRLNEQAIKAVHQRINPPWNGHGHFINLAGELQGLGQYSEEVAKFFNHLPTRPGVRIDLVVDDAAAEVERRLGLQKPSNT